MPGITGLITKMPRGRAERELHAMLATLRHDPEWKVGTWVDEAAGVYVGWVSRSDSSFEMPLRDERRDRILIFSGEEFPKSETTLSKILAQASSDNDFLKALNGRFHGVISDRSCETTRIFVDRYGMHRLYYYEAKEGFYFAAEAKAILEVKPELRTIDPRALGEFVACGCVLENRTLFEGIRILPPAAVWTFRAGSFEGSATYFDPREWEEQGRSEPEQYYRELREVFSENLQRYFEGTKVAMSLTGGLDTRMIMAWHKADPGSLPCYSFGGMFRDSADVRVARRVADACRQPHTVLRIGSEFLSRFAYYAERTVHLTDGCVAVNHAPDLYLNELAAKIAPIRMTGNYGGEVLRRVRAFKPVDPSPGLFRREFLPNMATARQTYGEVIKGHPLSFAVFRQAPWHHYGLLALEQTQVSVRSPYLDNDFVQTVFRAPEAAIASQQVSLRLIADGNPRLAEIRTDLGVGGSKQLLSIARRRMLEFSFKAEYAYDYGMPQWLARIDHAFSSCRLERIFLGRHKFAHFRIWYRDVLSKYVQEVLLDSRALSRSYIEPKAVETTVREHISGRKNNTAAIHKLLTLELIHRLFVDSRLKVEPAVPSMQVLAEQRA